MRAILVMVVLALGLVVAIQQSTIFQLRSACANYSEAIRVYETEVVPTLIGTINLIQDKKFS